MPKLPIWFCFALLGCIDRCAAQGVYSTGVQVTDHAPPPSMAQITASEGPNLSGGYGYAIMTVDSNLMLKYLGGSLGAIGVGVKFVEQGQLIDSSFSNLPFVAYQMVLGQPFLVGIEIDQFHFDSSGQPYFSKDRFGWAQLVYTSSGLTLQTSAIAENGFGIIAGTTTVLPEPSTLSLMLAASAGLIYFRYRRVSDGSTGCSDKAKGISGWRSRHEASHIAWPN